MKTLILSSLILAVTATTSMAATPYIDKREHKQAHRIYKGIANGELTFRETQQLMRGQARIHRAERLFKSDGYVSPVERTLLYLMQDYESHRIYRKKHN